MIGPHEGRELELMLKGEKHFALFHDAIPEDGMIAEDIIPDQAFAPHVVQGTIKRFSKDHNDGKHVIRYVCFTSTDNEWRAQAFFHFHDEALSGRRPFDDVYEYVVGRLLGYSEKDIAHYLDIITSPRTSA